MKYRFIRGYSCGSSSLAWILRLQYLRILPSVRSFRLRELCVCSVDHLPLDNIFSPDLSPAVSANTSHLCTLFSSVRSVLNLDLRLSRSHNVSPELPGTVSATTPLLCARFFSLSLCLFFTVFTPHLAHAGGEDIEGALLSSFAKGREGVREVKPELYKREHSEDIPGESLTTAKLLDEVEALKSQVVIAKRNALSKKAPREVRAVGAKTVFDFSETQVFEIHAAINRVTDIILGPRESLSGPPVSGDTVRWKIAIARSGAGENERVHIILKPLDEGIDTNLILATNKRTYHLRILSRAIYMPSVSWHYPDEELARIEAEFMRAKKEEVLKVRPEELNFGYEVKEKEESFSPLSVFDDGKKTYLKMPQKMKSAEAPVFFILNEDEDPLLVNYRVKGDFYIVDRLFERAELRVGKKRSVQVYSDLYKESFWERIF